MCLETVDKKEITDKIKATIPEEGLTVYKVVKNISYGCEGRQYSPIFQHMSIPYETGLYEADTTVYIQTDYNVNNYYAGFHFWLNKIDAEKCKEYLCDVGECIETDIEIIECQIKKEWITNTGMNIVGKIRTKAKTIVANKAIFPECKKEGN